MNTRCMILVLLSVVALSAATSAAQGNMGGATGAYTPIPDLGDTRLQDIAKFAVAEHNLKVNRSIEYIKLVSGDYQVVAGNNYRLIIMAIEDGRIRNYQAVVNDRPWESARSLVSFEPLN